MDKLTSEFTLDNLCVYSFSNIILARALQAQVEAAVRLHMCLYTQN